MLCQLSATNVDVITDHICILRTGSYCVIICSIVSPRHHKEVQSIQCGPTSLFQMRDWADGDIACAYHEILCRLYLHDTPKQVSHSERRYYQVHLDCCISGMSY